MNETFPQARTNIHQLLYNTFNVICFSFVPPPLEPEGDQCKTKHTYNHKGQVEIVNTVCVNEETRSALEMQKIPFKI